MDRSFAPNRRLRCRVLDRAMALAVALLAVGPAASAQERIYVVDNSPARLLAWSFDGASFTVEDPAPGSPGSAEKTTLTPVGLTSTDRWHLLGYGGGGLTLGLMDPVSGQELPIVSDPNSAAVVVAAPSGAVAWVAGPSLATIDLDPASPTFRQVLPGRIALGANEAYEQMVANPAGDRLYLSSRIIGVGFQGSILRVFDTSTPSAPALIGTYPVPPSADGTSYWAGMNLVSFGGNDYLALARRDLVLVPLVGGLPDLPNRVEWWGAHPVTGTRRRVHAVWAQDTTVGPRAFVVTNSFSGGGHQVELLVFDLAQPLASGPLYEVPVTAPDTAFDNERAWLQPSLDGQYLYLLQQGGELAAFGLDQCKVKAYDLAALASGTAGALLAEVAIDPAVSVCLASTWSVRAAPPGPPTGPAIADAVVVGAVAPNERLIVNDAPRTLAITGSGLAGVTHAYLGQAELTLGSVTATTVEATVPVLAPSGDPRLLVIDASGAIATFDGLRTVNPPQFLPGSKLYAVSAPRNEVLEMNASNANEVLSSFPTGQIPNRPAVTRDGRLLLVPGFRDAAVHVHSIVADPALGWDWNEEVTTLFGGYGAREIEVSADGRRAYLNNLTCKVTVLDLETDPPTLVDTDADPGTTDYTFFAATDPVQQAIQAGVTHIPIVDEWGECSTLSDGSVLSPDGHWLYLTNRADPGILAIHLGAHPNPDFVDPVADIHPIVVAGQPQFYRVHGMAMSPDGATLYWASSGETQVRVFAIDPLDGALLTEQAPIPLPGGNPDLWTLSLDPSGSTLFVAGRSAGAVHIFDLTARAPQAPATVRLPWAAPTWSAETELEELYEVDGERARLRWIGRATAGEARALAAARAAAAPAVGGVVTVPVGGATDGPASSPDGNWLFVAAPATGLVAIIDRRIGSPTFNQVLTTSGAEASPNNVLPSPGLVTPPGDPAPLSPSPGATIDYSNVATGGSTTVTSSNVSDVSVPADFQVDLPGGAPVYYDVTTDASFSGPVTVCFAYDDSGMTPGDEADVKLLHEEAGVFVDVTTSLDTVGNVVCGVVTGFSQFAKAFFKGSIAVAPPSPSVLSEPAGATSFTIRGKVAPTGSVTVPLAVTGECALTGGVTQVVLDSGNYLAGVTVGIEVVDDAEPETQEVCTVVTGVADADDDQAAYELREASDVLVRIDDDDSTDLAIAKSDGVAAVAPGAQTTYTITLANRGGVAVAGASFSDPLPAGASYAASGCAGGSNCSIVGGAIVTGAVDLAPGETATFTVTVDVDPGASGDLVNTATIDGWGGLADLFPGNDSATDTTRAQDADPPGVAAVGSLADSGDGALGEGEVTDVDITQLLVGFDESVRSTRAASPANYLLYRTGADQSFETADCAGVAGSDEWVAVDAATYAAQLATLSVNGGSPLPDGLYQLRVCAAIQDLEGNALDGDGDGAGGDDFRRSFRVDRLPPVVESLGADFGPGYEPFDPNQPTNRTIYWLFVTFDEAMNPASAADGANFLLLAEGGEPGFQTVDCAAGVAAEDAPIGFDAVGYEGAAPQRTTFLDLAGPENDYLPQGRYRLIVCGSTSVEDAAGRELDGNYDQEGGDDFAVDFTVDFLAPEPPATLFSTTHGPYTWSRLSTIGMRWSGAQDNEPVSTGIQGYDFVFTTSNEDTDYAIDLPQGADPHDVLSAPLPDGVWTFRIRSFDNAWNVSWDRTAGPYLIDTTAPEPPPFASSPSHDGGPSNDPTIDVVWPPGADNLSGLDGYSWTFDANATALCDETIDGQEWAASTSSPPLGDGEWYFHLCVRDNAGTWSATGDYGPWTIDTTAPLIDALDSVPEAGLDGVSTPTVTVALTQLLVGFSEAMSEAGAGAVTDAANWLLVEAGADAQLDTAACGPLGGDDVAVAITAVAYDAGTDLAALAVGDGAGLGAGGYRLLACGTLGDLAGNALAPWSSDFAVAVDPLTVDPNFDAGLAQWVPSGPVPAEWGALAEDAEGKPFSGAARLATAAGAGATWYLEQCVEVPGDGDYELAALARIASAEPGAPALRVFLTWSDAPACGGSFTVAGESGSIEGDTAAAWQPLAIAPTSAPAASQSVWISFEVQGGAASEYMVDLDRVLFAPALALFSDDFETGTPCRWAARVGAEGCP